MSTKVPKLEIIDSILNKYFLETEIGGKAEEDEDGTIYIKNADGSIHAHIAKDVWFELLNCKEEEENKCL